MRTRMRYLAMAVAAAILAASVGVVAAPSERGDEKAAKPVKPPALMKLTADGMRRWGGAPVVFVGKLERVQAGPVGRSMPPMRTYKLSFKVKMVLRGDVKAGADVTGGYTVRGDAPKFPRGKQCVVAMSLARKQLRVDSFLASTPAMVAEAKVACSVPLGWTLAKGKLLSPWAAMGKAAWPAEAGGDAALKCAKIGRPALLAGPAVKYSVAVVPPPKKIKWTNPDGDGEYEITVQNTSKKPIEVPALLTDGKNILWDESIVILCQGKTYTAPLSAGVKGPAKPVKLKPGEKVSGRINALMLTGPKWPRGGYRVEFTFCLGEKAAVQSFYYRSKHHDGVREAAVKARKAKLSAQPKKSGAGKE